MRRERTEIISHHDKVFVTKLPSVVEYDQEKLDVHNAYCGKALLDQGGPSRDDRFQRLHTTLSTARLNEGDEYQPKFQTERGNIKSEPVIPTISLITQRVYSEHNYN